MKVLIRQCRPTCNRIGCSRMEQHIAFFGYFLRGKHKIIRAQHTFLKHGLQGRSHIPKPKVGIGVLHPNGAFSVSKLARHQTEKEVVIRPFQQTPSIDLHIIQIQRCPRSGYKAQFESGGVGIKHDLPFERRRLAVFMVAKALYPLIVSHMIITNPYIVVHTILRNAAQHLRTHSQSLGFHQIGKYKRDNKQGILF